MKEFTNFSFHMYTDILFGKNTEKQVGEMIKKYGGTKVMFVYGGGSIKRSGLYDTIVSALNSENIPFVELPGVQANPRRTLVEQGLKTAKDEGVDFLLGVGGGSSIDTAKAIALALANDGEYWKFYNGIEPKKMFPVGTINTIAAAGSETSQSTVLVDDIEGEGKKGLMWNVCRPLFAIMDPELTYTVDKYQTGAGTSDIFSHTVMRYFTKPASYLGDQYAEATFRTVAKYGPIAYEKPTDYEARAELMLSAAFSHNDLTGIGRSSNRRGSEHGLERQLSGRYNTAHGAGLAVVMHSWLQYLVNHGEDYHVARVAQFARNVFAVDSSIGDDKAVANEGLVIFRRWLQSIGMPLTLKELGIPAEDLQSVIDDCIPDEDGEIIGFMDLNKDAVREIFTSVVE